MGTTKRIWSFWGLYEEFHTCIAFLWKSGGALGDGRLGKNSLIFYLGCWCSIQNHYWAGKPIFAEKDFKWELWNIWLEVLWRESTSEASCQPSRKKSQMLRRSQDRAEGYQKMPMGRWIIMGRGNHSPWRHSDCINTGLLHTPKIEM